MRSKATVFIVEDDPVVLSSVTVLLTAYGYEVISFDSAEAFLAANDSTEQGCLLTDMRLHGMNGLELLKTLKIRGVQLPVIVITGYSDPGLKPEALKHGAIAVLDKPVDPAVLLEHIQIAIQIPE